MGSALFLDPESFKEWLSVEVHNLQRRGASEDYLRGQITGAAKAARALGLIDRKTSGDIVEELIDLL